MTLYPKACEWFVECDYALPTATVKHPTLGDVEICAAHLEWLRADFSPTIRALVRRDGVSMGGYSTKSRAMSDFFGPDALGPPQMCACSHDVFSHADGPHGTSSPCRFCECRRFVPPVAKERRPTNVYKLLHRLCDLVPWSNEAEGKEAHEAIDEAERLSVFGTQE